MGRRGTRRRGARRRRDRAHFRRRSGRPAQDPLRRRDARRTVDVPRSRGAPAPTTQAGQGADCRSVDARCRLRRRGNGCRARSRWVRASRAPGRVRWPSSCPSGFPTRRSCASSTSPRSCAGATPRARSSARWRPICCRARSRRAAASRACTSAGRAISAWRSTPGPQVAHFDVGALDLDDASALSRFLDGGGWIAWGAIPTHRPVGEQPAAAVEGAARRLVRADPARLRSRPAARPGVGRARVRARRPRREPGRARDAARARDRRPRARPRGRDEARRRRVGFPALARKIAGVRRPPAERRSSSASRNCASSSSTTTSGTSSSTSPRSPTPSSTRSCASYASSKRSIRRSSPPTRRRNVPAGGPRRRSRRSCTACRCCRSTTRSRATSCSPGARASSA